MAKNKYQTYVLNSHITAHIQTAIKHKHYDLNLTVAGTERDDGKDPSQRDAEPLCFWLLINAAKSAKLLKQTCNIISTSPPRVWSTLQLTVLSAASVRRDTPCCICIRSQEAPPRCCTERCWLVYSKFINIECLCIVPNLTLHFLAFPKIHPPSVKSTRWTDVEKRMKEYRQTNNSLGISHWRQNQTSA